MSLGKECPLPSWGWVLGEPVPSPNLCVCKIHVECTNFASFCEDYHNLSLKNAST